MCSRINLPSPTTQLQHTEGLRRRLRAQAQREIDAARARGDHRAAELLILRQVNYPAWVKHMAREHAASVAGLPIDERSAAALPAPSANRNRWVGVTRASV